MRVPYTAAPPSTMRRSRRPRQTLRHNQLFDGPASGLRSREQEAEIRRWVDPLGKAEAACRVCLRPALAGDRVRTVTSGLASGTARSPAWVTAYIHGPAGSESTISAMAVQWSSKDGKAVFG
jgi:hypothetical protein